MLFISLLMNVPTVCLTQTEQHFSSTARFNNSTENPGRSRRGRVINPVSAAELRGS